MRGGYERLKGRRLVVHLKDEDRSIRGVLHRSYPDSILLAGAEYLAEAKSDAISGDQLVLKSNISFSQVL